MSFFKKKELLYLTSIVKGEAISIESVKEEMFSTKVLGDGLAFIPSDNTIVAPADCEVCMMNEEMMHAIGLKLRDGLELLIHIGIDTVKMNNNIFKQLVEEGTIVKRGEPLVIVDFDAIKTAGFDETVILLITDLGKNNDNYKFTYGQINNYESKVVEW